MTKAELEAKIEDLQRQCNALFKRHGLPSWEIQERQRLDNAKSQGTKPVVNPTQHFGEVARPKPHEQ
jgi:hypothetical protein